MPCPCTSNAYICSVDMGFYEENWLDSWPIS